MGTRDLAHSIVENGTLLLASADPDEAADLGSKALRPHRLGLRGGALDAHLWQVRIGEQSATRLAYGTAVGLRPGDAEPDDYLLSLPIAGEALVRHHGREALGTPTRAVIVGPGRDFGYDLDAACDQIILRLPRQQVESVASALTGTTGRVLFDLEVTASVGGLSAMIEAAIDLTASGVAEGRPHLLWQMEQVIVESLILGQPNSRSAQLQAGRDATAARRVRAATSYMHDHLAEPLSIVAVASACGVSVRSLQEAFRGELGTTPGQWLKAERIQRAHALLGSGVALSVTEVAYSCGIFHLGEFGAAFKERYGVTPSAHLAAHR